jgi:predicted Zn-ribbon and HTH transcriptional regulator
MDSLLEQFKQAGLIKADGKMNASFIKKLKNRPEWIEQINDYPGASLSEKIDRLTGASSGECEICGNATAFKSFGEGYARFCSDQCKRQSMVKNRKTAAGAANPETLAKMRATCKARYGIENMLLKPGARRGKPNMTKPKATLLERYGVEHPSAIPGLQQRRVTAWKANYKGKDATKASNVKKYGVEWAQQSPIVIEKIKNSRHKHTFESIIQSPRFLERLNPLFSIEEYKGHRVAMPYECKQCGSRFESAFEDGKLPRCPTCYPVRASSSAEEQELALFIKSILPSDTVILRGDTKALAGKELDIYIPSKKVAVEYNGNYWHSEISGQRNKHYHLNKSIACEEAGIRLLHIFSDEWIEKSTIVKSVIKAALGVFDNTIGARKLRVEYVPTLATFYDDNHIQGRANSSVNIALKDPVTAQVLAGLSFKKPRFSKDADWEITRFAVKCGYSIPGAFGRLLKRFRADHSGSIVTYSERRLFTGNVYKNAGFQVCEASPPAYCYTKDYQHRENRMRYQKHLIPDAQQELSEWENMQLRGYDRIWDCGCWKFLLPE